MTIRVSFEDTTYQKCMKNHVNVLSDTDFSDAVHFPPVSSLYPLSYMVSELLHMPARTDSILVFREYLLRFYDLPCYSATFGTNNITICETHTRQCKQIMP
jgi:hypothetical protein